MRTNISSDAPWEPSLAIAGRQVDNHVYVRGQPGRCRAGCRPGVYEQTIQAIRNVETALHKAGASLRDVVRTRVYLTDILQWEEAARLMGVLSRHSAGVHHACRSGTGRPHDGGRG